MTRRVRQLAAAGAMVTVLTVGGAGVASANGAPDQHSGGVSPGGQSRDPGGEVLGGTITRGSGGSLPFTGADVLGLSALGLAAVGVGVAATAASRRAAVDTAP